MCTVPNIAIFCMLYTSIRSGGLIMYLSEWFLIMRNESVIIRVASVFRFHIHFISIFRSLYLRVSPLLLQIHCYLLALIYRLEDIFLCASDNYVRTTSFDFFMCKYWHIPEYDGFRIF